MTHTEMPLSDLIDVAIAEMQKLNHSKSTTGQYRKAMQRILNYFIDHSESQYSRNLMEQFIHETLVQFANGLLGKWRYKIRRKAALVLIEVAETGTYCWHLQRTCSPNDFLWSEHCQIMGAFVKWLQERDKAYGTISLYETVVRRLFRMIQGRQISLKDLSCQDIGEFVKDLAKTYQPTSMRTALSAARNILTYLFEAGYCSEPIGLAIPSSCSRKNAIIPKLTFEEEDKIIGTIDRGTAKGKRDYALIMLALCLGLRDGDIVRLKLENIEWKSKQLRIVQQKTGEPLILPLLDEVADALADYVLHARPPAEDSYVFRRIQAPHQRMSSCYCINARILQKAHVRQEAGTTKGMHLYRHSLASVMVNRGVPLSIISQSLGHSSAESSKPYLSTDEEHLRLCALTLEV